MKKIQFTLILLLLASSSFTATGQDSTATFDGKKWEAPYSLDTPQGWDVERFLIPISFAPAIPYKGVEDIRFTPGWAKKDSDEYWSYTFLWYLDDKPAFNTAIIEKNLVAYYTGLMNVNIDKSKIAAEKLLPAKASVKKRKTEKVDVKTFEGSVIMLDYMTMQSITLNLIIHVRSCPEQNKTFVFHEVSPRPYSDTVWNSLHQLWLNFRCTKN